MSKNAHKRPNAMKHGVFSLSPTLPWEDAQEFKALYSELVDEWNPCGPTEEEAVFGLAELFWRKLRLRKFIHAKLVAGAFDPSSPAFDRKTGLRLFLSHMYDEPATAFERYATQCLHPAVVQHLKRKFPRQNYKSASEWAAALITEIKDLLLATPDPLQPQTDPLIETIRRGILDAQLSAAMSHASKFLERELDELERLDGMIVRKTRHLVQTKGMKQMLRQISTEPANLVTRKK